MDDSNQQCPFVQFTHALLVRPELNSPVLHLQHDSGFNINIVFYLLWLAKARFGRVTKYHLKVLQTQITLWHQRVVAELKYTHALVADNPDPIAVRIKQALQEAIVKAHFIEQQMLYESKLKTHSLRRTVLQQLADACASVIHYCELKNDLLMEEDQAAFIQLFSAVFDMIPKSDIEKNIMSAFEQLKTAQPTQLMWEEF